MGNCLVNDTTQATSLKSIYTPYAKSQQNQSLLVKINVESQSQAQQHKYKHLLNEHFVVYALYHSKETMKNVFDSIEKYFQQKCHPLQIKINRITSSFAGVYIWDHVLYNVSKNKITLYNKDEIATEGLSIVVGINFQHQISSTKITCKHMNKTKTKNPLCCPVYYSMTQKYQFNQNNLDHLNNFIHFINEYEEKPECKQKQLCKAFIRCENGGTEINDECHMKLYKHPPRSRNIKLSENTRSLIVSKSIKNNHPRYEPTNDDKKTYLTKDEMLKKHYFCNWEKALLEEVVNNGYKFDLCLECNIGDDCKHNGYSILQIVEQKIFCNRHKMMGSPLNRAHMLALVLYTGCECNYDLCASHRRGDYTKWKWFDYCLFMAITALSAAETGKYAVYSGLNNVKLDQKKIRGGYFVTYVSTSWRRDVATTFMGGNNGMILQFGKDYKCQTFVASCDVSWISKFPDECEVLFARSMNSSNGVFHCTVIDESNGVQTALLT